MSKERGEERQKLKADTLKRRQAAGLPSDPRKRREYYDSAGNVALQRANVPGTGGAPVGRTLDQELLEPRSQLGTILAPGRNRMLFNSLRKVASEAEEHALSLAQMQIEHHDWSEAESSRLRCLCHTC